MAWASEQTTGSATRKAVLMALANAANHHTGRCHPSMKRIATETELSSRSVERATADLLEMGFLARTRRRRSDGTLGTYSYSFPAANLSLPSDIESAGPPDTDDARPPDTVSAQNQEGLNQEDGTTASAVVPLARDGAEVILAAQTDGPERVWRVDRKPVKWEHARLAAEVLSAWNELTGQDLRARTWLAKIVMRIREYPEATLADHRYIITTNLEDPWWKGEPTPSVIYGNDAQFERAIQTARSADAFGRDDERLAQIVAAVQSRRTA